METVGLDSTMRTKRNKKKKERKRRDRISDLPEAVLHHILSFLDMKYVVQTSVLSKTWRYVWKSVPILNFDFDEWKLGKRFRHFVDNVLLLHDACHIHGFRLSGDEYDKDCDIENRISSWIRTATRRKVQQLYLIGTPMHRWPHRLFTCRSLRVLELICFNFISKISELLPESMSLPHLETLVLRGIGLDNVTLNKIFSSCPVLESFTINDCIFFPDEKNCYLLEDNVEFYALNLKHLVMSIGDPMEIEDLFDLTIKLYAPNLVSLSHDGYILKDYVIENLSSLVKAEIDLEYLWDIHEYETSDEECK